MHRRPATALTLVLVAGLAGCYTYAPIPVGEVAPSMIVRIEADRGTRVERLEGRIFEVDEASLSLLPEVRPGMDNAPLELSFAEVGSVSRRTLHTGRTLGVLGAGIAAGIVTLLIVEGEPGDTREPPGGGGGFDLIPLVRSVIGSR